MKRFSYILFVVLAGMSLVCSCSKDDELEQEQGQEQEEQEKIYPTFEAPGWTLVSNPNYSVTMTVIASLPESISDKVQEKDELAAFVGDECRGIAKKVDDLYYIMINGTDVEKPTVYFRYYSAATKYMYRTEDIITFKANDRVGTVANPFELPMKVVEK